MDGSIITTTSAGEAPEFVLPGVAEGVGDVVDDSPWRKVVVVTGLASSTGSCRCHSEGGCGNMADEH